MALDPNYALTKQGTTDAYKGLGFDPNGDNEAIAAIRRFLPQFFQNAQSGMAFGQELQGQKESAIQRLLRLMDPANQQAKLKSLQAGNTERGAQGARQASLMNRSMGLGDGFQAGTTNSFLGAANRQNNDLARQFASPEMAMENLKAVLQTIGFGQDNPAMDQLFNLNGMISQRDQQRKAQLGSGSLGKQLAGIGGMIMGNPSMLGLGQKAVGGFGGGIGGKSWADMSGDELDTIQGAYGW
jgi:hypothetical protein